MKHCKKCEENKYESEFGKDRAKKDGLNFYCRECIRKRSRTQRLANPDYANEYAKSYRERNREKLRENAKIRLCSNKEKYLKISRESYHRHKKEIALRRKDKRDTPEAREKSRVRIQEWRARNKGKYRESVKKWQQTHKERHNAHQSVHRAVENGTLIRRLTCERCEKRCKTEGHHKDYAKPLQVEWLCRLCHAAEIRKS